VIIAGLSMGVYFRVRKAQVQTASETTINKLSSNLDQQWKAANDIAKYGAGSGGNTNNLGNTDPWASQYAGGDGRLALVIHTKITQKLEFPQTFWEAIVWPSTISTVNPSWQLQPKPSYWRQITAQVMPAAIQTVAAGLSDNQMLQESAVLLYISMGQARRGMAAFNATEAVGPYAVGTTTLFHYPGNPTFSCFVDNWGQPIAFIRWPFRMPLGHELNSAPYATFTTFTKLPPALAAFQNVPIRIDPADPEGLLFLVASSWSPATMAQFQTALHPLPTAFNAMYNLTPIIISAGPDKQFETQANGSQITDYGITATFNQVNQNEFDNLYSYRMRGQGRR
jgi:hypothetical protein